MSTGKSRNKKNTGVTLFEVLIAIALFAIIIVPVMRSFVGSIRVNQKARKTMIATDVAETIAESFAGKSYEDVLKGLNSVCSGFDFSNKDSKYAFSTINDNFYNKGHAEQVGFPATVVPNTSYQGYTVTDTLHSFDKVMAAPAVSRLREQLDAAATGTVDAGYLMDPYTDNPFNDAPYTEDGSKQYVDQTTLKPSIDKVLYYGVSGYDSTRIVTEKYSYHKEDPLPYMVFMVYHRIQKDNYFFDAIVTLVPRAQNTGVDDHGDPVIDTHFAYEVKITVYDYEANAQDHEYRVPNGEDNALGETGTSSTVVWTSRYVGNYIEGTPIASMTTGIQSRGYLGTDD